jgi:nicotinate-nucleotide--dimethylbenzimidazole phosphoribosyltransferase
VLRGRGEDARRTTILSHEAIRQHLDSLTKPPGSLGRLEDLAARLCLLQGSLCPATRPRKLVLFAGDHGVTEEGVSAWPSRVTELMLTAIVEGGAAGSVLARQTGTELLLVDVGSLAAPLPPRPGYLAAHVRAGTRNLAKEPALTVEEFDGAWEVGATQARQAAGEGMRILATGEMGIGNSTPASCLTALLAEVPVERTVGRGAGADDSILKRKRKVVEAAVSRARELWDSDRRAAVASVGGLEIAAMAGFLAAGAGAGLTLVLDGFIATAAALVAETFAPGTAERCIAAHQSAEPGHAHQLAHLGLRPFLDTWELRLGEGTGALLLMPLLDAAAAVVVQMATLRRTGVVGHE